MKTETEKEIIEKMLMILMGAVNASGRVKVENISIQWDIENVAIKYNQGKNIYNVSIAYDSPLCALKDVATHFLGELTR